LPTGADVQLRKYLHDNNTYVKAMNQEIENAKAQMRKGVLELCVLTVLSRGDSYANDLINQLKQAKMIVVEGTIYPLLTRQKNAGLLTYRWEESPQGPPRKYYSLTEEGKEYLAELLNSWDELVEMVDAIRNPKND
jgi:PadR family transcriptional regulator PadR